MTVTSPAIITGGQYLLQGVSEEKETRILESLLCSVSPDELLAEMEASGCRSIYYGVETGSQRMQKLVDKHLNLELVEPRLATTRRLGMTATAAKLCSNALEVASRDLVGLGIPLERRSQERA